MAESKDTIIDKRRTYRFYLDDVLMDEYASQIGVYGIAVYALLARHAKNGQSFPSYKHITKTLGIGRATVVRTLAMLEEKGLITIEARKTTAGDSDSNLYTILDLSHHHGGGSSPERPPSSLESTPSSPERRGVVLQRDQGGLSTELEGISFKDSHRKEEERERPPSVPNAGKIVKARASRQVPETFELTDALREWAQREVPGVQVAYETGKFKDWEFKTPHTDWCAAWRNWMRRAWENLPLEQRTVSASTQSYKPRLVL